MEIIYNYRKAETFLKSKNFHSAVAWELFAFELGFEEDLFEGP